VSDLVKAAARVVGWTLLQALVFLAVFEAGKAVWDAAHGWRGDVGRGVTWSLYFRLFVGLALVANAAFAASRAGTALPRRVAVWSVAVLVLVAFTLPSWSALPLAVPFVHGCALVAVIVREGLGRLALRPRSVASG
jgi:hypothetical protein